MTSELMPQAEPIERTLAHMWMTSVLRAQPKRTHAIPDRVTWLPCGCTRENGWEGDVNNRWRAIDDGIRITHAECRNVIGQRLPPSSERA